MASEVVTFHWRGERYRKPYRHAPDFATRDEAMRSAAWSIDHGEACCQEIWDSTGTRVANLDDIWDWMWAQDDR